MEYIRVTGGIPLNGEVRIQSSKNATLPLMAAALLADGITVLKKCPTISDVFHMIEIMEDIGCNVWWEGEDLYIDTKTMDSCNISCPKAGCMRSSCLFLGSLIGRWKEAAVCYPGGCVIGKRPIDMHISGMKQMGIIFEEDDNRVMAKADTLQGATIHLSYPSVGATENLMVAAVLADGITKIYGCAREPEVVELSCFLNKMGARVKWLNQDTLLIEGVHKVHPVEFEIMPDRIVAGTYLLGAVATRGKVVLHHVPWTQLKALEELLVKMGASMKVLDDTVLFDGTHAVHGLDYVKTLPYPAFPTDLQSQLAVALALGDCPGIIEETVFESRFATMKELKRMQADVTIQGRQICIRPVAALRGTDVHAYDLRGGAALVIAGLTAEGVTKVTGCEFLERGYVDIVKDFAALGAKLEKIKE